MLIKVGSANGLIRRHWRTPDFFGAVEARFDRMSSERKTRSLPEIPKRNEKDGPPKSDYVAVARGKDLVVIRVTGRGNMANAPALQEFVEQQREAGFTQFLFDFERCSGLDSTFMGVMVGMHHSLEPSSPTPADESGDLIAMSPEEALEALAKGVSSSEPPHEHNKDGSISAVNVSKDLLKLLAMLGVDVFIKIRGSYDLSRLETTILPEKNMTPPERSALIYKAHQLLVEADKRNEAHFGALLKSLAQEMNQK